MREADAGRLAEAQVRGLKLEELRIKELRADVEGRARAIERQEAQLSLRIQVRDERNKQRFRLHGWTRKKDIGG